MTDRVLADHPLLRDRLLARLTPGQAPDYQRLACRSAWHSRSGACSRTEARRTGPRLRRSARALAPRGRTRTTRGAGRARSVRIPRLGRGRALRRQGGKPSSPPERAFRRSTLARAAPGVGGRRGDRVATNRIRDRGASARGTAYPRSATSRERPDGRAGAGHEGHSTLACPGCRAAGAVDRSRRSRTGGRARRRRNDVAPNAAERRRARSALPGTVDVLQPAFRRRGDGSAPLVFSWLAGRGLHTTRLNLRDSRIGQAAARSVGSAARGQGACFPSDWLIPRVG